MGARATYVASKIRFNANIALFLVAKSQVITHLSIAWRGMKRIAPMSHSFKGRKLYILQRMRATARRNSCSWLILGTLQAKTGQDVQFVGSSTKFDQDQIYQSMHSGASLAGGQGPRYGGFDSEKTNICCSGAANGRTAIDVNHSCRQGHLLVYARDAVKGYDDSNLEL